MVLPRLTVLNGRYAIGRVLRAPGALVASYQAWNLHTEDQVVIEEYFPATLARRVEGNPRVEAAGSSQEELFLYGREQFLKEASVLASVRHPSLVRLLEYFEEHNTAYRVVEHYKGATLDSVLEQQGGKLAPKTTITIAMPLLEGLQAVHQNGLLHGAISPGATFLAKNQGALLRGFRTAQIMLAQRTGDMSHLLEGYSAPEQYESESQQGPWTDVYGCAALLYRMLTGKVLPEAMQRYQKDEVSTLLQQAEDLSKGMRHVLAEALSLDYTQRPHSVQAFQQRLHDAVQGKVVVATEPVSKPEEPSVEMEWSALPDIQEEATLAVSYEAETQVDADVLVEEAVTATTEHEPPKIEPLKVELKKAELPKVEPPKIELKKAEPPKVESKKTEPPKTESKKTEPKARKREIRGRRQKAAPSEKTQRGRGKSLRAPKDKTAPVKHAPISKQRERLAPADMRSKDRAAQPAKEKKKMMPVLIAGVAVMLVALSGAFVLMQDSGSTVAQFAHFKAQGDSLFALANYADARTQYENALSVNPNDNYVSGRLSETEQLLSETSTGLYYEYMAEGDSLFALAESLLNAGDAMASLRQFTAANKVYFEGLQLRPNDPILIEKGRLTSEAMDQALESNFSQQASTAGDEGEANPEEARQQLYNASRQQGDALFNGADYITARERYTRALTYAPGDEYATERLQEIEDMLSEADLEQQVQQALTQGNTYLNEGRYAEAKVAFQGVLNTQPGTPGALDGIVRADSMIAANQQDDQQYQYHRGQGDVLVAQGDLKGAVTSYETALSYKPFDTELQGKIQETEQAISEMEQEQLLKASMIEEGGIYKVVEEAPELIGGLVGLHRNVRVPRAATRAGIYGRVYVQFIIDENGRISDPEVIRGIGSGCDEEAVRVIKRARFKPGKVGGQPVKMRHTLFISFPDPNGD